jgi:hypothetical protein
MQASYGRGFALKVLPYARDVQPQQSVFSLLGRTYYAAPILAMTKPVYELQGDVTFTPETGRSYVVKGILAKGRSAVWIEDDKGQVMDHKITKADAELGLLEK